MREIPLSRGKVALVDDEDYEFLSKWKWSFHPRGYATRTSRKDDTYGRVTIPMHRAVLRLDGNNRSLVDHVNTNKLDKRRSNLRLCTPSQNHANKPRSNKNTSGYKGVSWDSTRQKWKAGITVKQKARNLGRFSTPEEAHAAYLAAAREAFGEFANSGE